MTEPVTLKLDRSWLTQSLVLACVAVAGMAVGWFAQLRELDKGQTRLDVMTADHTSRVRDLERDVFGKEQRIRTLEDEKQRHITVICECGRDARVRTARPRE